ncbi:MAG TPA: DNA cytosine methyltransferase [Allosphingosinicella sp.]|nr:DNA cytosine methyltransferase [Allosphingosinicella sp.]
MATVPFIDIFAGPGGLSEGFSRHAAFSGGETSFESRLAIEKDAIAAQTLRLRSFYRAFPEAEVTDDYYQVVRGQKAAASLALRPEWLKAEQHVWNATLGEVPEATLHSRIATALEGDQNWVLLGGPPCQAYSLMGRARMTGIGAAARAEGKNLDELRRLKRSEFAGDHRHVLYREYLRIVAIHQPAVFVMENVKGILSSRLVDPEGQDAGRVFEQIRTDLSDPGAALAGDIDPHIVEARSRGPAHQYRLYSLVIGGERQGDEVKDREFLIPAEDYGVPQRRHRVILLGIRDDLMAKPEALKRSEKVKVKHALDGFPPLRSGLSKGDTDWTGWLKALRQAFRDHGVPLPGTERVKEVICDLLFGETAELTRGMPFIPCMIGTNRLELSQWYSDPNLGGIIQHESRSHMSSDLARYAYASATAEVTGACPRLEEWPPQLLPKHRNVQHDKLAGKTTADGFNDRFKVQIWEEPASTVTSHIAKDGHYFIHPDPLQCRSLTVREAARLQTFPDNYYFCGNRTQQYHQVGNAVPPYLAYQIAKVVAQLLKDAKFAPSRHG